jgi:hypothetical protein
MTRAVCTASLLIAISVLACTDRQTDERRLDLALSQAGQLLEILRSGQWAEATAHVLLDDAARNRFGLPTGTGASVIAARVEALFRDLYEGQPPGPITSARFDPRDTGDFDLMLVSYRHGDLDSFHMRLVNDRWLYSFE